MFLGLYGLVRFTFVYNSSVVLTHTFPEGASATTKYCLCIFIFRRDLDFPSTVILAKASISSWHFLDKSITLVGFGVGNGHTSRHNKDWRPMSFILVISTLRSSKNANVRCLFALKRIYHLNDCAFQLKASREIRTPIFHRYNF